MQLKYFGREPHSSSPPWSGMPAGDPQTVFLKTALSHGIRTIWAVMCGLAGLALATTLFMKHYDLNRKLVTEQGFEEQEKWKKDGDTELASAMLPDAVVKGNTNRGNKQESTVSNDMTSAAKVGEPNVAENDGTAVKTGESSVAEDDANVAKSGDSKEE